MSDTTKTTHDANSQEHPSSSAPQSPTEAPAGQPSSGDALLTELEPTGSPSRRRQLVAVGLVLVLALAGLLIWRPWSAQAASKYSAADRPLRIFASVTPHAQILNYVAQNLASKDLKVTVIEETDGVNGNDVVEHGDADVSYYEHVPYLNSDSADKGYTDLQVAATVHVEPYGIYSSKYTALSQVPDGGLVLLSNNVSNFARGLYLLQDAGLITLNHKFGDTSAAALKITEKDIVTNPKHLQFRQVEPAQIPRSLPDAAIGLINGNVALEAGLNPAKDALLLEKAAGNPYGNILVVPKALADDPRVKELSTILEGPQVAAYITAHYPGSVIPVAGSH
jgi:D-methionine transport system substrate-binding protein